MRLKKIKNRSILMLLLLGFYTPLSHAITQGENAELGRWHSMVALVQADKSVADGFYCAANLIAPQWLITAAHCVNGASLENIEAVTGLYTLDQSVGAQRVGISNIIVHPNYNALSLNADVALLKLNFASSQSVVPIFSGPSQLVGLPAIMLGWGHEQFGGSDQNTLQQVLSRVISNATCGVAYTNSLIIQDSMVCAGDGAIAGAGGPSLCTHDSGGPLMVEIEGQDVLLGVASFSLGCGVAAYSGFSRLSSLLDFVQSHVPEITLVEQQHANVISPILLLLLDD